MPTKISKDVLLAYNRFGYGARPGDLAKVGADPRALLKAELQPDKALIPLDASDAPALGSTTTNIQTSYAAGEARKAAKAAAQQASSAAAPAPMMMAGAAAPAAMAAPAFMAPSASNAAMQPRIDGPVAGGGPMAGAAASPGGKPKPPEQPEARIYRAEALARFQKAASADVGLVERLVAFWSNHFCVSIAKGEIVRATAGSFEREAIRPFVLGRFADMSLAVERHPAMLFYLDNAQSVGPDSRAGQNRRRGLNENLARETLELHTLGVDGGYTQADVTSLARVITGWTFAGREGRLGEPGSFVFNANMHEPGDAMVVGHAYGSGGFGQGEAALNDLARHPATAHHIALKLARHFVADVPPPALVERLATVFRNRDGDLRAVTLALIDAPEAWNTPPGKLRSPYEFLIAAVRLLGVPVTEPGPLLGALRTLGMPLWEPPGPNGWPDDAAAWASPEGIKLRLDVAAEIAHRTRGSVDPLDLLDAAAASEASVETRDAMAHAESREQAIALLLMSPELQRI